MDKPSVWRAVVSTTDPRRPRDPGCGQPPRPSSAMAYRLYDMPRQAKHANGYRVWHVHRCHCVLPEPRGAIWEGIGKRHRRGAAACPPGSGTSRGLAGVCAWSGFVKPPIISP
ncbi:hypothetical protein NHX12_013472 [Muraenolepis orangiensis]|uniref:Uncharacterized protein n=1 Tax=Muraenolepis orangiensis TaxID=630683 RepID=A0A9Q0I4Z5_9TELE|nr:hypothetical protein NHX12_013472 [Muraenolepis orangiensis]